MLNAIAPEPATEATTPSARPVRAPLGYFRFVLPDGRDYYATVMAAYLTMATTTEQLRATGRVLILGEERCWTAVVVTRDGGETWTMTHRNLADDVRGAYVDFREAITHEI